MKLHLSQNSIKFWTHGYRVNGLAPKKKYSSVWGNMRNQEQEEEFYEFPIRCDRFANRNLTGRSTYKSKMAGLQNDILNVVASSNFVARC
jgi:hypothetical protein